MRSINDSNLVYGLRTVSLFPVKTGGISEICTGRPFSVSGEGP